MNQLLGAHTSISGGVSRSVTLAEKLGFTAMQIFTKNNNRWSAKPLEENEIQKFRTLLSESNVDFVVSHDSYLINLCAKDAGNLEKSREAFIDELERCETLGIKYLNFHPGSHVGQGEDFGINMIAESLNIAHQKTTDFKVSSMLELTAGQGTNLGFRFEQIAKIIELVDERERMTTCIDTAHIFAAGYNIKDESEYEKVIRDFDSVIGLDRLKCFHMNDSKKELGSRVDRHEHIGKGFIGLEGFKNIMNDSRLTHIPKVLETPKGKEQLEDIDKAIGWWVTSRSIENSIFKARRILTNSRYTEKVFLNKFPTCIGKTYPAMVGLGSDFMHLDHKDNTTDCPRLITISRLSEPRKNINLVLNALGKLKENYIFKYTIIGDGHQRSDLEAIAHRQGLDDLVEFRGFVERNELINELSKFLLSGKADEGDTIKVDANNKGLTFDV